MGGGGGVFLLPVKMWAERVCLLHCSIVDTLSSHYTTLHTTHTHTHTCSLWLITLQWWRKHSECRSFFFILHPCIFFFCRNTMREPQQTPTDSFESLMSHQRAELKNPPHSICAHDYLSRFHVFICSPRQSTEHMTKFCVKTLTVQVQTLSSCHGTTSSLFHSVKINPVLFSSKYLQTLKSAGEP